MKWKKLILLGDSNTQYGYGESGWVSDLSNSLQRKCDVINRGFSGYNTDFIKVMLPQIMEEFDPNSICGVVIMLGSNDSTEKSNLIQHVPLDRYEKNLAFIIDYFINWGVCKQKLILISPPRIYDKKWEEVSGPGMTHHDHLVKEYANSSIKIAIEKEILYLDFNKLMYDYGSQYHELFSDGLHLSSKGGNLLFEKLLPIINEHIGNDLKFNFPYWRDLKQNQIELTQ